MLPSKWENYYRTELITFPPVKYICEVVGRCQGSSITRLFLGFFSFFYESLERNAFSLDNSDNCENIQTTRNCGFNEQEKTQQKNTAAIGSMACVETIPVDCLWMFLPVQFSDWKQRIISTFLKCFWYFNKTVCSLKRLSLTSDRMFLSQLALQNH